MASSKGGANPPPPLPLNFSYQYDKSESWAPPPPHPQIPQSLIGFIARLPSVDPTGGQGAALRLRTSA